MKEMRKLALLMRDWAETHHTTPAHKVKEWADAIMAANGPVAWNCPRELTLEEVKAEKALYKVYQRLPGARTPFTAWLRRATIAANTPMHAVDAFTTLTTPPTGTTGEG